MKRITVLTSGGDAPGMNAAIRAVVRTGLAKGWEVYGVEAGYSGLMNGNMRSLGVRDVSGIIQQGGTMLGSARAPEFKTEEGRQRALRELRRRDINALIVIGGNGSQTGSNALSQMGFPVVGIASTIDNDLYGSEITLGVDTALNIALETIVIPEREVSPEEVANDIRTAYERGKAHAIVVVAEGAKNNAEELEAYFKQHHNRLGFELRATKLGYVQRGGQPTAFDRLLGTRFGAAATACIEQEQFGVLVGINKGDITTTPLAEVVSHKRQIDLSLLDIAETLS